MLDHDATSAIAPAGADLRVVANVRMATPGRRVAALRVAMRVTVTEQDEDIRSLVRAVKQAVRTLALVALLLAALAAGAANPAGAVPATLAGGQDLIVPAGTADSADRAGQPDERDGATCSPSPCAPTSAPDLGVAPPAPLAPALATGQWSPVVAESDRLPRPALAARVLPSPD